MSSAVALHIACSNATSFFDLRYDFMLSLIVQKFEQTKHKVSVASKVKKARRIRTRKSAMSQPYL